MDDCKYCGGSHGHPQIDADLYAACRDNHAKKMLAVKRFSGEYRKRPVIVGAIRFISTPDRCKQLADFLPEGVAPERVHDPVDPKYTAHIIRIPTLEGEMTAQEGDWIIKGVRGEFYPCKDDVFVKTYVSVDCPNCTYMREYEDESKWPVRCGTCGMPTADLKAQP